MSEALTRCMPSMPVWDGLATANGRLYLAAGAGKVACFAPGR